MKQKSNTSVITGKIIRSAALRAMVPGGITAALILLALMVTGERYYLSGVFLTVIAIFLAFVIFGLIRGWFSANKFKNLVKAQEKGGFGKFDEDTLRPITTDSTAWLGEYWLLMSDGLKFLPYNKAHIASCNAVNERKDGMKKLWLGLVTDRGEKPAILYAACEPDTLAVVENWLGGPAVQPIPQAAPFQNPAFGQPMMEAAAPVTRGIPSDSCPYCFGPNKPEARFCQWCGKQIR